MPPPRRRRRFFAASGRLEVGDSGEAEGIVVPSPTDPAAGHPGLPVVPAAADVSDDDELPPAFRLNRAPRARPEPKRRFLGLSLLLPVACLGAGGLGGYLLARNGDKPAAPAAPGTAPKTAVTLTPADANDLDAAYAARHAHDYTAAERLFTVLERRHPDWGPIKVELGRTLFYENKPYDASAALKTASDQGWSPAEANFLLGVLNKTRQAYPEAETSFARAVAIDPTQSEYYFFWGECLRDEGKVLEAIAKFRSALLRNQYETATGLYRAKMWLCAIEAEQDPADGVNAQVDAALAESQPPMEAFVAAAARDIRAGNFGAAAVHLSGARGRADATVFRYIIGDPLFAPARTQPECAEFFRFDPPATPPPTDPVTGSSSVKTP